MFEVSTNEYEFSHGRKPRGQGRWAFKIGKEIFWSKPFAKYSEALSAAKKFAAEKKETFIRVLP